MIKPTEILEQAFAQAQRSVVILNDQQQEWVRAIINNAEHHKGVLAVLMTSLTKKIETPAQDIRQHKVELPGGYSGRTYDTAYITPFIRSKFPRLAMGESGWLTRSLEQVQAFTLDFPGKIRNKDVKTAFLHILNDVEINDADPKTYLIALIKQLLEQHQPVYFEPGAITNSMISVAQVIDIVHQHFQFKYRGAGASRLPVLALYSVYQLLMPTSRYQNKRLLPLKRHTTSDRRSRSVGDIELENFDGSPFEAVEVKHNKPIDFSMVQTAFEKIQATSIARYYLLTTAEPNAVNQSEIEKLVAEVHQHHGCEIIINGVMPTLKYYLRLTDNPEIFLDVYQNNLEADYARSTDIKKIHLEKWLALRQGI